MSQNNGNGRINVAQGVFDAALSALFAQIVFSRNPHGIFQTVGSNFFLVFLTALTTVVVMLSIVAVGLCLLITIYPEIFWIYMGDAFGDAVGQVAPVTSPHPQSHLLVETYKFELPRVSGAISGALTGGVIGARLGGIWLFVGAILGGVFSGHLVKQVLL